VKNWKDILIVVLLVVLAFILGKRFEARAINEIVQTNLQLSAQKLNTELAITKNGSDELKNYFRQLGYNIPETPPQGK